MAASPPTISRPTRFPWANVALAVFLVLPLVTGLVGLLGDSDPYRISFWLHAIGHRRERAALPGSYERGTSFAGVFPEVSWINDDPAPVDAASWRLVVDGVVGQELELTDEQIAALPQRSLVALLDCTRVSVLDSNELLQPPLPLS